MQIRLLLQKALSRSTRTNSVQAVYKNSQLSTINYQLDFTPPPQNLRLSEFSQSKTFFSKCHPATPVCHAELGSSASHLALQGNLLDIIACAMCGSASLFEKFLCLSTLSATDGGISNARILQSKILGKQKLQGGNFCDRSRNKFGMTGFSKKRLQKIAGVLRFASGLLAKKTFSK